MFQLSYVIQPWNELFLPFALISCYYLYFFFLIYNVYKKHIFKFLCERTKLEPQTLVDQLNQLPDSRIFFSLQEQELSDKSCYRKNVCLDPVNCQSHGFNS